MRTNPQRTKAVSGGEFCDSPDISLLGSRAFRGGPTEKTPPPLWQQRGHRELGGPQDPQTAHWLTHSLCGTLGGARNGRNTRAPRPGNSRRARYMLFFCCWGHSTPRQQKTAVKRARPTATPGRPGPKSDQHREGRQRQGRRAQNRATANSRERAGAASGHESFFV